MTTNLQLHAQGGFSILEIMIAIAILGISLTAIFSSEAGAIRMANRANKTAVAVVLARCKMGEVEEQLAKEGMPAILEEGSDNCCEDANLRDYTCQWKVSRIQLPDSTLDESENPREEAVEKQASDSSSSKDDQPQDEPSSEKNSSSSILDPQTFAAGDITQLALQYVYPLLQPTIEEQVRRVDVTIQWQEGDRPKSFNVVQYLVSPNAVPVSLQQLQDATSTPEGDSNDNAKP